METVRFHLFDRTLPSPPPSQWLMGCEYGGSRGQNHESVCSHKQIQITGRRHRAPDKFTRHRWNWVRRSWRAKTDTGRTLKKAGNHKVKMITQGIIKEERSMLKFHHTLSSFIWSLWARRVSLRSEFRCDELTFAKTLRADCNKNYLAFNGSTKPASFKYYVDESKPIKEKLGRTTHHQGQRRYENRWALRSNILISLNPLIICAKYRRRRLTKLSL